MPSGLRSWPVCRVRNSPPGHVCSAAFTPSCKAPVPSLLCLVPLHLFLHTRPQSLSSLAPSFPSSLPVLVCGCCPWSADVDATRVEAPSGASPALGLALVHLGVAAKLHNMLPQAEAYVHHCVPISQPMYHPSPSARSPLRVYGCCGVSFLSSSPHACHLQEVVTNLLRPSSPHAADHACPKHICREHSLVHAVRSLRR